MNARTSIVIGTRDRGADLLRALAHLADLPERPGVVVVDNGSADGSCDEARRRFGDFVQVLELPVNMGAAARNLGACVVDTPFVAFNDDDSWWAPGALRRAERWFDARPQLGLLCGRVLVGEKERLDPTCAEMAASPIPAATGAIGPAILGFVACGAIVRREVRNALWSDWLRRPARPALARTGAAIVRAARDRDAARGVVEAAPELPWALRGRRRVPRHVVEAMAAIA